MATIITIAAGDLPTNSRADLNTNFSNLNSDKIETSVLDTDTALTANSDAKIATQKAVKAYVDTGGNVNASETSRGIVEEATDAEVTAGTATGGTGAKLIVTPAKLATNLTTQLANYAPVGSQTYSVGAGSPTFVKTYFNCQLPFIIATGSVSGAATTDLPFWIRTSTDVAILTGGAMARMTGAGAETMTIETPFYGSDAGVVMSFTHTNIIIMDTWVRIDGTNGGDLCWGFADAVSTFDDVYDSVARKVVFAFQDTGDKLYGSVSNNTTNTATEITGITLGNWNNYRIVINLSTDVATFYVNGVLKATVSTTFPTTGNMQIGYGRNTNATYDFTAPNISISM